MLEQDEKVFHGEDAGIMNDENDTLTKSATRIKTTCTAATSDLRNVLHIECFSTAELAHLANLQTLLLRRRFPKSILPNNISLTLMARIVASQHPTPPIIKIPSKRLTLLCRHLSQRFLKSAARYAQQPPARNLRVACIRSRIQNRSPYQNILTKRAGGPP